MSCGTCHQQRYAFGYSYDKRHKRERDRFILSHVGGNDILPLFNLYSKANYMWDGRAKNIRQQLRLPIHNKLEFGSNWTEVEQRVNSSNVYKTMFAKYRRQKWIDSNLITDAIVTFELGIISNHSKYDEVLAGRAFFTDDERQGFDIVKDSARGNCLSCHSLSIEKPNAKEFARNGFLLPGQKDFGLFFVSGDSLDKFKFRIPSIRNLGYTAPYMHNATLPWLDFVLSIYNGQLDSTDLDSRMSHYKQGGLKLTHKESASVLAFLNTLNDTALLSDKRFENPFK